MIRRAALLLLFPAVAAAQTGTPPGSNPENAVASGELPPLPQLPAVRLTGSIRIDGKMDEAVWATATPASNFIQVDPAEGQPATERTELRVLYDEDALYVGARMFDREPHKIRAHLARRDEPLWNTDLVELYIDAYHNRLTGNVFRITPASAVRDAAVLENGDQDNSWDVVWEGAATIDSLGWTAEYRIPFSQLRYNPTAGPQTWGLQFARTISRKGELHELAFTPKRAARGPQRWATLTNLIDLPRARHLELLPYVTSRAEYLNVAPANPFRGKGEYQIKTGVDLKYGLTSSMALTAAVNPDFGQVEVDPARVNLTANELFFPERRPFFVEGADIFQYGRVRTHNSWDFPTFFHSRRIGRPPQLRLESTYPFVDMPDEATIGAAAKVAGRPRPGLSLGVLDAVTMREKARFARADGSQGEEAVEPLTNYFVGRLRQDFNRGNTNIGLLATGVNRDLESPALASLLRRDAYFVGADLNQSWKQREWVLDGALGRSGVFGTPAAIALTQRSPVHFLQRPDMQSERFDPNRRSLYGTSWQLSGAKYSGKRVLASTTWQGVSPGFEVNDVGFHSLTAYNALSGLVAWKNDQPGRVFRNWVTAPFAGRTWNFDGDLISEYYGYLLNARLLNFWSFEAKTILSPQTINDRLTRGGPLAARPKNRSIQFDLFSDPRRIYSVELNYDRYDEDEGSWTNDFEFDFTIRPSSALRISFSPEYETSRFAAQFLRRGTDSTATATYGQRYLFGTLRYDELALVTRVDWTFSPALSVQMFVQPLVADGRFFDFKSLRAPRTFEFDHYRESDGTLTRDASGYVAHPTPGSSIPIGNPNFSTLTLIGNAVMRWEFRPGSALFLVWQQRRNGDDQRPGFVVTRDVGEIFRQAPENVFAIKATYWIGR